jgi:uncharacterized protein (DUF305 family)
MISLTTRLAAGVAAVIAAAALAACSSASTGMPAAPATPAAAAAHNATDVSFTSGIIRLEDQARAVSGLVATHTGSTQLLGYATRLAADVSDFHRMSGMMARWHQVMPSPYRPGAAMMGGTGPGMMSGHDWSGMQHRYGHEFIDHWVDAMMANRSAELALCRHELRAGASPQARHLAQTMLAERQAQLAQLQHWHHTMGHHGDHAEHSGH